MILSSSEPLPASSTRQSKARMCHPHLSAASTWIEFAKRTATCLEGFRWLTRTSVQLLIRIQAGGAQIQQPWDLQQGCGRRWDKAGWRMTINIVDLPSTADVDQTPENDSSCVRSWSFQLQYQMVLMENWQLLRATSVGSAKSNLSAPTAWT